VSGAQKVLIIGGLILAAFGMLDGLHFALFVEHQTLEGMGASLNRAFVAAAEQQPAARGAALASYARTKYVYVRQVDVHSHWIGLAMLLIVLGAAFESVIFTNRTRLWIAFALLIGAAVFPLGVWLQTVISGPLPSALAIFGSALVTTALAFAIIGFSRTGSGKVDHSKS